MIQPVSLIYVTIVGFDVNNILLTSTLVAIVCCRRIKDSDRSNIIGTGSHMAHGAESLRRSLQAKFFSLVP